MKTFSTNENAKTMNMDETQGHASFGRWKFRETRMRRWIRWSAPLICATLTLATVQAQSSPAHDGGSRTRTPDASQKQFASLLREPLPGHAHAQALPLFYKPESLYQYIDGGADLYLLYGFNNLLHQDFKSGVAELTVDIYEMDRTEDAFGIYAAERSPGYKFVLIGAEGYRDKGVLNFLQDHYYVKISGSGADADALLEQFARLLSRRIGGTRTLPALLENLPREHQVPHSSQYARKDPLGHAFLAPAYIVAYAHGKQESKLMVSVANNAQEAKSRSVQLAKHFKQSGECISAPELGEDGIRARNNYEGRLIARTRGRYVIALLNPPENGAEIMKTVAQSLP